MNERRVEQREESIMNASAKCAFSNTILMMSYSNMYFLAEF